MYFINQTRQAEGRKPQGAAACKNGPSIMVIYTPCLGEAGRRRVPLAGGLTSVNQSLLLRGRNPDRALSLACLARASLRHPRDRRRVRGREGQCRSAIKCPCVALRALWCLVQGAAAMPAPRLAALSLAGYAPREPRPGAMLGAGGR